MAKHESRVTSVIKFNLYDRGWQHNGKDRSNYDVQGMIDKFNSPAIQEQVEKGKLNGFCGHQIRQRYGMIPPETGGLKDGNIVLLEPGIRTIYLKAHSNGDVEHRQEFYNNPTGDHILRQYKAKQGGFSTAMNFFVDGDTLRPNVFGGFDYVFSQNFLDNACTNEFDSMEGADNLELIHQLLEGQIVAMYDSIAETSQVYDYLQAQSDKNRKLEADLRRMRGRDERRRIRQKQLEENHFDSMIASDTTDFDQVCMDANKFLGFRTEVLEDSKQSKVERKAEKYVSAIGKIGGFGA